LDRTTFCADIVQGSLRLTNFSEFSADLQRLGITHVMAPRAMAEGTMPPDEAAGVGFMIHEKECELIGKLLREGATLRGSAGDQGLYELSTR
jgi:carbamate kinase